ncbi:beta-ketoacyl-[acyl-carrier-protein] synthase II [Elizabethkingia meningoseptica]|uniref:3-oxoacyl-[acyl-carrier-protein] synthase 2 n=1 Tax=Elizabethkingia meningoseptica TaxID=238 RepID=A0A1T3IJW8_ELIME|nr:MULTISPECIES: beta-ketoacyl-ACP synthase II [Elizabethkingia]AQX11005.1 beta-ketoacyl-[acyl-carrier-protein] synthase II [Elizabethkingia meningoseptica]MBG0512325.1 beta-ketoacyl-ACP synthase II [Elizabethkingia meningoseptica]MDE5435631.1 beta-ketoacyl-ACP synthase II [Elizabethkingia meningoseptica]MDE5472714.1 beta-ketoacyl-ACP synthase II [Elizabethkingia meningoseptica]MDE5480390.1 beta-ketoacyl-ACP synthase II [Elizabethkingia meningoseptica]
MKRVVITGLGAITPLGNNVNDLWQALISGTSGANMITKFDTEHFKTKFACEVKNFNPLDTMEKAELRKYDLFTQYALASVHEAVLQAKINFEKLNKDRIGVIWASGDGGVTTFEEQLKEFHTGNGVPRFSPYFIPKRITNIASGVISIKYGLRGVNYATVAACSASNTSIIDAFNYIRWGKADMMITGGSEASITQSSIGGFNASKAMSTNNENYKQASRPFDIDRDGFVLGEGAGAVILESYEHAIQRNAPIIAEIVGGGLASDAYHITATHPEGSGAILGMSLAMEEAGITVHDIDYINLHATSTPTGDLSELKAIDTLFSSRQSLSISATKSMTGHLLGAAGAIEAIACIKAIQENIVPPTINTRNVEPEFAEKFDLTLGVAKSKTINHALSNTFGFGGHIGCSIFKKFEE